MTRFVALLRGINVGGKHRVPMAELRRLVEGLGHGAVETYVQSGNVLFDSPARSSKGLGEPLESAFKRHFAFQVPILVRSAAEWSALVAGNPFPEQAEADGTHVHAIVLEREPLAADLVRLEGPGGFEDRFEVKKRVLYLWTPDGMGRSKLAERLPRALPMAWTGRNWKTVLELERLLAGG